MPKPADYDVVILGGGVAGLTAALQITQERPATRIAVVEKRTHPVEETAFKVGESVAEVAAIYLKEVLGLEEYMLSNQHRKMALRWFCSAGDNSDITKRVEFGPAKFSPLFNFHVDRGGLENHLVEVATGERGVELIDGARVTDVEFEPDRKLVSYDRGGSAGQVTGTWIIDSTGRAAVLRRKLDLSLDLPIDANAAWFRLPYNLCIDDWSDDPTWQSQVPTRTRWKSTISFLGEGYWVWVINLASGSVSVGVVADPRYHSFDRIRRYQDLLEFLREHEPQLAAHLPEQEDTLMDFMKRKRFAYGCIRAFSRDRWCLTGEAACLVDPLYSTGLDFTAVGNSLATDLITLDLNGADESVIRAHVRNHNRTMAGLLQFAAPMFEGQLVIYRDPRATAAKFLWDNTAYFNVPLTLFKNGLLPDPEYGKRVQPLLALNTRMNLHMQSRFREWSDPDFSTEAAGVVIGRDSLWTESFYTAAGTLDADEVEAHIERTLRRLHSMMREMETRMYESAGRPVPDDAFPEVGFFDEPLLRWAAYEEGRPLELDDDSDVSWQAHPPAVMTAA